MKTYKQFLKTMDINKMEEHINKSTELTIKELISYGNVLSEESEYIKGLKQLLYYIMFYPIQDKKAIINFATGGGKSTAMNNGCAYLLAEKTLQPYSGTIILKLTKEDCEETVNSINKKVGKELAYAYHSGMNHETNQRKNQIDNNALKEYPIVVLTHSGFLQLVDRDEVNKLCEWSDKRISTTNGKYNTFYRERLIIDEAITNVQFMSINIQSINMVENAIINMGNEDVYDIFNTFIMKIKKEFLKPYEDLKKNKVFFSTFEDIEVPEGLDELFYNCNDKMAKESYMAIRTMLATGGYINIDNNIQYKSITTYKYIDINIPYFYKITLDATSNINYLYKIDSQCSLNELPEIKSYKNVHLKIFQGSTGSSSAMQKGLDDGLLENIIEDIKSKIIGDEKVLIVTNSADRDKLILNALKDYEKNNQIEITHYGLTVGNNRWGDFDKIFVLGIQLLPDAIYPLMYFTSSVDKENLTVDKFNSLDTTLVPIKGSRKYKEAEFEKVKTSVIASLIVQTLNRIKCRKCISGQTPETFAYLINRDKEIDNLIAKAMPDIQITYDWELGYESKSTGKKVTNKKDVVETLIEFFEKVRKNEDNFNNNLIEKDILTDKGLNKSKIKELLSIKTNTFNVSMSKPLMIQYIKDNKIDIETNNRYVNIFKV